MFLTLEQIQAGFDAGEDRGCRWYWPLWNVTCLRYELDEDRFPFLPMLQISKFGSGTNLQISNIRSRAARLLFKGIERHALALQRLKKALRYAIKLKRQITDCADTHRFRLARHIATSRGISRVEATSVVAVMFDRMNAQATPIFNDWMERFQVLVHQILRDINDHWMQLDIKAVLRKLSWDVPDRHWALLVEALGEEGHAVPAWLQ